MIRYIIFFNVIILVTLISCKTNNNPIGGKIAIIPNSHDSVIVIDNKSKYSFGLDERIYSIRWMNRKDELLALHSRPITVDGEQSFLHSVISIDTNGDFKELFYETKPKSRLQYAFPSFDDEYFLIVENGKKNGLYHNNKEELVETFVHFNIYSVKERNSVCVLKIKEQSNSIEIEENPWSFDNSHFIYTNVNRTISIDNNSTINKSDYFGVYVFHIEKGQSYLIAPNGKNACCSPVSNSIAYLLDNKIWIYNIDSGMSKVVYEPRLYERITDIHWSPDGNKLLVTCPKLFFDSKLLMFYNEKLIRVEDGESLHFDKINKGFAPYTWR